MPVIDISESHVPTVRAFNEMGRDRRKSKLDEALFEEQKRSNRRAQLLDLMRSTANVHKQVAGGQMTKESATAMIQNLLGKGPAPGPGVSMGREAVPVPESSMFTPPIITKHDKESGKRLNLSMVHGPVLQEALRRLKFSPGGQENLTPYMQALLDQPVTGSTATGSSRSPGRGPGRGMTQFPKSQPTNVADFLKNIPEGYGKPSLNIGKSGVSASYRPKKAYPEGYKTDLQGAVKALDDGKDPHAVYRRIAEVYPEYSTELKRILLATESAVEEEIKKIMSQNN